VRLPHRLEGQRCTFAGCTAWANNLLFTADGAPWAQLCDVHHLAFKATLASSEAKGSKALVYTALTDALGGEPGALERFFSGRVP
jgi:hypothetical protein